MSHAGAVALHIPVLNWFVVLATWVLLATLVRGSLGVDNAAVRPQDGDA